MERKRGLKTNRLKEDGWNLDLTYITPRILVSALPEEGIKFWKTHSMKNVVGYLDTKHGDRYKVYNICAEASYTSDNVHGHLMRVCCEEHSPPPLSLIEPFCEDAEQWLHSHPDNVVVIQSKGGRGRACVMASSLLLHLGEASTVTEAIRTFSQARASVPSVLALPSQLRFLNYYKAIVTDGGLEDSEAVMLEAVRVFAPKATCKGLFLVVQQGGTRVFVSPDLIVDYEHDTPEDVGVQELELPARDDTASLPVPQKKRAFGRPPDDWEKYTDSYAKETPDTKKLGRPPPFDYDELVGNTPNEDIMHPPKRRFGRPPAVDYNAVIGNVEPKVGGFGRPPPFDYDELVGNKPRGPEKPRMGRPPPFSYEKLVGPEEAVFHPPTIRPKVPGEAAAAPHTMALATDETLTDVVSNHVVGWQVPIGKVCPLQGSLRFSLCRRTRSPTTGPKEVCSFWIHSHYVEGTLALHAKDMDRQPGVDTLPAGFQLEADFSSTSAAPFWVKYSQTDLSFLIVFHVIVLWVVLSFVT